MMKSYAIQDSVWSDNDYIWGLKNLDNRITHYFFYKECYSLLNTLKNSIFDGKVEYDELVNELYIELSAGNWRKLDSFSGINGCRLRTWLSMVSWHLFFKRKFALMNKNSEEEQMGYCKNAYSTEWDLEIALDVEKVMSLMKNENYVSILNLILMEGYSPGEVAMKWNKTVDNIYNIKHRAIKQFLSIYIGTCNVKYKTEKGC